MYWIKFSNSSKKFSEKISFINDRFMKSFILSQFKGVPRKFQKSCAFFQYDSCTINKVTRIPFSCIFFGYVTCFVSWTFVKTSCLVLFTRIIELKLKTLWQILWNFFESLKWYDLQLINHIYHIPIAWNPWTHWIACRLCVSGYYHLKILSYVTILQKILRHIAL